MLNSEVQKLVDIRSTISQIVFVPHGEQEYNRLASMLDDLINEVGGVENHPLTSSMDLIGTIIEKYEDEQVSEIINE